MNQAPDNQQTIQSAAQPCSSQPNHTSTAPAHQAEHPERHSTWPETPGAAQRRERGDFGGTGWRNVSPSSASLSRSMSSCPLSRPRRGMAACSRPLAAKEMAIAFSRVWPGGFGWGVARRGAEEGDKNFWGEAGFAFAVCFRLPSLTAPAFSVQGQGER